MDAEAELDKVITELDEHIALCRKRLETILSALKWTEDETLRDKSALNLEKEHSEDEDDPPLPQSFGCENSVIIGVDQLKAITRDETAAIAKKFTDIQSKYTREQKRDIYDYVISNTKRLKEPEVKVTVLNNNQAATDMTIAQIVAKAKANAKIQSRKYSTSKPTHIEEIREMLKLQMQALNQLCKPKPKQPHTNTSRKPRLDMVSPFPAPSQEDGYRRSKSRDGRSPFRRPSLDMIKPFRVPSCERSKERRNSREGNSPFRRPSLDVINPFRAPSYESTSSRGKSRDARSPFRRPSLDMINPFRAPSCESTSSKGKSQSGGSHCSEVRNPFKANRSESSGIEDRAEFRSSECSYRQRSQSRSRENLTFRSPPMDRISHNRGRAILSTESNRGGFRDREQSVDLRVDMLHRMSDRRGQTNDIPAVEGEGTPFRIGVHQGKELSPIVRSCKDGTQQINDRGNAEPKNKMNPFRDKTETSSCRATQSKDSGSQCRDRMETLNSSADRWTQNRDERSRSKSLPKRGGLEGDERKHGRRDIEDKARNMSPFRRYSQSGDRRQSWIPRGNSTSPCTSGTNRESGRRDLNECTRDLTRVNAEQGKWSLNQSRDKRYQRGEYITEKEEMYSSGRRNSPGTYEKSRRDKRNHSRDERHQIRDNAIGDTRKSRHKRSRSSSSTSKTKSRGKRSQVKIKRKHSRKMFPQQRSRSQSSLKERRPVGNTHQTQANTKCSSSDSPRPPQGQPSPKKSKSRSKSRACDEKHQPSQKRSRASQETGARSLKDSPTTRTTSKDIRQMLKQLQKLSRQVAPRPGPI